MFQSLRVSAIFIGFSLLVVSSVLATLSAIQTQSADATVINLAGRQRMLSQRLLWLSVSSDDPQVLAQPALRAQLNEAAADWMQFRAQLTSPEPAVLQTTAARLLAHLDAIVSAYEMRAQAKLAQLQTIQAIFLISASALLAGAYYGLRTQLLRPLTALNQAAQRMTQGDLTWSIITQSHDELSELALAFEAMPVNKKCSTSSRPASPTKRSPRN